MRNVHCLQSGLVFSSFSLMQYHYDQNFQFPSENYEVFLPFLNQQKTDSDTLNIFSNPSFYWFLFPTNRWLSFACLLNHISLVLAEKGLIIFEQILKILVIVTQYTSDK